MLFDDHYHIRFGRAYIPSYKSAPPSAGEQPKIKATVSSTPRDTETDSIPPNSEFLGSATVASTAPAAPAATRFQTVYLDVLLGGPAIDYSSSVPSSESGD